MEQQTPLDILTLLLGPEQARSTLALTTLAESAVQLSGQVREMQARIQILEAEQAITAPVAPSEPAPNVFINSPAETPVPPERGNPDAV